MQLLLPFENEDNYNFDNDKIEIISQDAKLKAIVSGADAELYCKLDDNKGLVAIDSSGNDRHGAFQGGLDETTWTTGKINSAIEGQSGGIINFNSILSFERTDTFSLESWVKFTSAVNQAVIARQINSGTFEGYALVLAVGKARFTLRDKNNISISVESSMTINDNIFHHIVVTYDGLSSHTGMKVFVDNVDVTTNVVTGTLTGSIQNTVNVQISGRGGNNLELRIGTVVDEALIYSRELTPAEIAFRWNSGAGTQQIPGATTSFPVDNPTLLTINEIRATSFTGLSANITKAGLDDIRAVMVVNGTDKYWDGSNFIDSSDYSESNNVSDINTNALALISELSSVNVKWFFHSDDGTTTPILLDYSISFDNEKVTIILVESVIFGNINKLDSTIPNKIVTVRTFNYVIGTNLITTSDKIPVILNPDGTFRRTLYIEDTIPDGLIWEIVDQFNVYNIEEIKTNFLTGVNPFGNLTIIT
jgi:hypothetical protein